MLPHSVQLERQRGLKQHTMRSDKLDYISMVSVSVMILTVHFERAHRVKRSLNDCIISVRYRISTLSGLFTACGSS